MNLRSVGQGASAVGKKIAEWVKTLQTVLKKSSRPPFGSVQPSKNWRWLWQQRRKKGFSQERRGRGVWAPGLEMIKDWLPELQGKLLEAGHDEIEKASHHLAELVKLAIITQAFKWKPLTERYIKWKKRKGRDTRILIATGEYVQSIQVTQNSEGDLDDVTYTVGLPDKIHVDSGLPIRKLAAIHEFGAPKARIPARPVWQPVWKMAMPEIKEKVTARIKKTADDEAKLFQRELQRAMPGVTVKVKQG
jgi:phage gpG-like protein